MTGNLVTVVLTGAAVGLRGHVTRWLVEIAPGVFVGRLSQRVAESVWRTLRDRVGDGHAILIARDTSEQGFKVYSAGRDRYEPVEVDGLIFFARPKG